MIFNKTKIFYAANQENGGCCGGTGACGGNCQCQSNGGCENCACKTSGSASEPKMQLNQNIDWEKVGLAELKDMKLEDVDFSKIDATKVNWNLLMSELGLNVNAEDSEDSYNESGCCGGGCA